MGSSNRLLYACCGIYTCNIVRTYGRIFRTVIGHRSCGHAKGYARYIVTVWSELFWSTSPFNVMQLDMLERTPLVYYVRTIALGQLY